MMRGTSATVFLLVVLQFASARGAGGVPAVPGDQLPSPSVYALEQDFMAGGGCVTGGNLSIAATGKQKPLVTTTPVGCFLANAVAGALVRSPPPAGSTAGCVLPSGGLSPDAAAALSRYRIPSTVPDTAGAETVNGKYWTCILACIGAASPSAGGVVTVALWQGECYCMNASVQRSPPLSTSPQCCQVSPGSEALAAEVGVNTSYDALFLTSVSNVCAEPDGTCRADGGSCQLNAYQRTFHRNQTYCCRLAAVTPTDVGLPAVVYFGVTGIALAVIVSAAVFIRVVWFGHREDSEPPPAPALGTIVAGPGPVGTDAGAVASRRRLRQEDEAASLTAVLMIGMRRAVVADPDGTIRQGADDVCEHEDEAGCAVCLSHFVPGSTVSELPCGHRLHSSCLIDYVHFHLRRYEELVCPTCRAAILPEPGSAATPSSRRRALEQEEEQQKKEREKAEAEGKTQQDNAAASRSGKNNGRRSSNTPSRPVSMRHVFNSDDDDDDDDQTVPLNPINGVGGRTSSAAAPATRRTAAGDCLPTLPQYPPAAGRVPPSSSTAQHLRGSFGANPNGSQPAATAATALSNVELDGELEEL